MTTSSKIEPTTPVNAPQCGGPSPTTISKITRRKRVSAPPTVLSTEEKAQQIESIKEELEGLFRYYKEFMCHNKITSSAAAVVSSSVSEKMTNSRVAILMEESELPLTKLVEEIHAKLFLSSPTEIGSVTLSCVKSAVLFVGQRVVYGLPNVNADVLEDQNPDSLWCWETRDLKMLPKSIRGLLQMRRMCRKKIHERITAISAMMAALQKSDSDQTYRRDVAKASEKLHKVLKEADIRLLVDSMLQKNAAELADREVKREEKLLIRQLEKNKREAEKEKKRMDLELQKEQHQIEKEQRKLQEETEKEEKKQLRKQQEEAGKERRRKEKEESELKRQVAVQKQASIMERFLKRSKPNSPSQSKQILTQGLLTSASSSKGGEHMPEVVTASMDCTLSSNGDIRIDELFKSHLSCWRNLGRIIRSNKKQHWSIRHKPKAVLFEELKLTTTRDFVQEDEASMEKVICGCKEDEQTSLPDSDCSVLELKKCMRRKQLLQFDKSYRPAFYGIRPKKSHFVRARCPLTKDPDLDYDVDSDEEWEEEEPGESLSNCDKDDEESMEDGLSKADDEEESEDGFFVPDGYLSENEGVQVDKMEIDVSVAGARTPPRCKPDLETHEFCVLLQQQKYLSNMTQNALRKNQPLIILSLMHERVPFPEAEDAKETRRMETCLQALRICTFPGGPPVEISLGDRVVNEEEACPSNDKATISVPSVAAIRDTDMPLFVSTIKSCSQSISKVVGSLQQRFPGVSKSCLRNKVREISDFVDNHWQVKKEVLDEIGTSTFAGIGKSGRRVQHITTFLTKRCMPPTGNSKTSISNPNETSPEPCLKSNSLMKDRDECSYTHC